MPGFYRQSNDANDFKSDRVTIGDTTYDCTKYYLPDHREVNTIEILQHTI